MRWNAVAMSLGAAFQNSKGDEAGVFGFAPLIAIVEIAVTVGLFFWGRRRKSLSYEVYPLSPVVSVNRDFHCSVQQALVRIQNTGNQPIEVGDYEGSLRVSFGSEARISQSNLVETEPNDLPVSISDDPAEITVEPLLLNRGDSFVLSALLVGEIDEVKVGGRISGVSKIRRKIVPENPLSWKRMRMALGGLMVFSTG